MKKDLLLIITGLFLGISLSFFISDFSSNQIEVSTKIQETSKQKSNIPFDNTKHIPNPTSSKSRANQQTETHTEKSHPSNTDSETVSANDETEKLRTELVTQIHNLPDYKVKWVKEIVDQAEEPPVEILFESEIRDPDRAIGLEDKLRYDFYEQNILNGEGRIDSLECRARYCKARVSLPKNDAMVLMRNMQNAFPGIILLSLNRDKHDDSNLISSDIYIDLQSYEVISILEDAENP